MRRLRGRVLKDVRRSHTAGRKNAGTGIPGLAGAGRAAKTKPPSLTPAATSKTPNAYANSIMQSNSQKPPSPPHYPQSPRRHATESSKRAAKVPKNRQAGASGKEVRDGTKPDSARKLGCEYRFWTKTKQRAEGIQAVGPDLFWQVKTPGITGARYAATGTSRNARCRP